MHRLYPISIILAAVLVLLGQASAAPTPTWPSTNTFYHRQANGNPPSQPFTTQTVQTIQTEAGPVTETCTFTFTPVTGSDGESLVQVVRACTTTGGAPPPPPNDPGSASSPPPPAFTSTSTSTPPPQTPAPAPPPPATDTTSSTPSSTPTPLNPVFSSVPVSMVPSLSSPPSSSPTLTSSAGPASSPDTAPGQPQSSSPVNGTVSPDTAPDTTPTPDATPTPQGAFQIPGKKISVLPIGLGIFAGISVIALIVVGLVTYERTKYRKIFRQRKLAEMGSAPGYGGMGS